MKTVNKAIRSLKLTMLAWEAAHITKRLVRAYSRRDVKEIAWCRIDMIAVRADIDRI